MLPLRKHIVDVVDIFNHYVKNICVRLNKSVVMPDKKILQSLRNKEWHGNVKELISFMQSAYFLIFLRRFLPYLMMLR